jgi:hypothetical protein
MRATPTAWRRLVEWSLVAGAIVILVLVFGYYARFVQGQGELAAVRLTVGALRSTLATDDLRARVRAAEPWVSSARRNPFELLSRRPANYRGEVTDARMPEAATAPGSWVFDRACACVGYRPIDSRWLDSPSGDAMVWFYVKGHATGGSPDSIGPLQLIAREAYRWQGQPVD